MCASPLATAGSPSSFANASSCAQAHRVVAFAVQFDRKPSAIAEGLADPCALPRVRLVARQPQREGAGHAVG
jgi:hypothetical protein